MSEPCKNRWKLDLRLSHLRETLIRGSTLYVPQGSGIVYITIAQANGRGSSIASRRARHVGISQAVVQDTRGSAQEQNPRNVGKEIGK